MTQENSDKYHLSDFLWDVWCCVSIVGIWPRFIEPTQLTTSLLKYNVEGVKLDLKIAVFSDLHFHSGVKEKFLQKIHKKISEYNPDLILFLGDFLCNGELESKDRLTLFLKKFKAPLGCYAILGNHDYSGAVSANDKGDYDITNKNSPYLKAFLRLFKKRKLTGRVTPAAARLPEHQELLELLKETPFQLLNNETKFIKTSGGGFNLTGLGDYMLGRALPEKAYKNYRKDRLGIILTHNPDMIPKLAGYPGELILSGHTHGGQINLPWIWKKLAEMENSRFKDGVYLEDNRTIYVSRGVGSTQPFRWFAPPELLKIRIKGSK